MERLLISACLMGADCKYSGGNNLLPQSTLSKLRERFLLVPVCPETAGGLPTPRDPSERFGERVVSCKGADVTGAFLRGAQTALELSRRFDCKRALLKANSPSCGSTSVYDGSFTGRIVPGRGVTAELLMHNGIEVISEENAEKLI